MAKHITQSERKEISLLLEKEYSHRDIAIAMSRNHRSISREIKKNSVKGKYNPQKAQQKAQAKRRFSKYQGMKVEKKPKLKKYIIEKLKENWTPEQIAGRLKEVDKHISYISSKGIYKWLYSSYGQRYCKLLAKQRYKPRKRRKKKIKKQIIPNRIGIEKRPMEANCRLELGHFEEDTMVSGKKHKSKTALAVFCDRKAKYSRLKRIPNLRPQTHMEAEEKMADGLEIKTITKDNGLENRYHEKLANALKVKIYFCNPYSSWEKGTVENTIGRVRRFIPKGEDIANYSHQQIAKIEHWLNHTPRKCLKFRTPYEIMFKNQILHTNSNSSGGAIEG